MEQLASGHAPPLEGWAIPPGVRQGARVLVFDSDHRLLLLKALADDGHFFWLAPGGGLELGESFEAAAIRDLHEETGLVVELGPFVWVRRHIYKWGDRQQDLYDRFFIGRARETELCPCKADSYVVGHRWWPLDEILQSTDDFAPRRIREILPPLLNGEYPHEPIDCGV